MPSQEGGDLSQRAKPGSRKKEGQVRLTFLLSFLIFSAWLAGIFLAPYLQSLSSSWARLVYAAYAPFCHQIPERSLSCFGHPLAVCTRCLGIYSGILLGLILYPFIRGWKEVRAPESRVFFSLSAPIVLDTAANFLGVWKSSGAVRLATGLLWGVLLPFYLITGWVDFLRQRQERIRNKSLLPGH